MKKEKEINCLYVNGKEKDYIIPVSKITELELVSKYFDHGSAEDGRNTYLMRVVFIASNDIKHDTIYLTSDNNKLGDATEEAVSKFKEICDSIGYSLLELEQY